MTQNDAGMKVDLAKLKSFARQTVIKSEADKIDKTIESLHDRQEYARYHYHTYKNIISKVDNDLSKIKLALKIEDADWKDTIAIKANITSCIQSIHITHDILAYLIAKVLQLEINENKIYLGTVRDNIKTYTNLKKLLQAFTEYSDYNYLTSYVNHNKHRFHIDSKLMFHFTGNKHFTASFEAFNYKGKSYEMQEIDAFILREYNREQKLILEVENELINILEAQQGEN